MDVDYRGNYKQAIDEALVGGIGIYADFDKERQQECFRLLSTDRDRLLKFTHREGITAGKIDSIRTLKAPDKPIHQMIAVGDDTRKIRSYMLRMRQE
jgi:hypothetical protein